MKTCMTGWLAAIALTFFGLVLPVQAQQQLVAGRDYAVIDPVQPTDNPAKIEVVEFFSYACPHCNDLNPHLAKWAAKLPSDVTLKRVPVSFIPYYQLMAKLYYALETVGELQRLDEVVFNAMHNKGVVLRTDEDIIGWVAAQPGVDAKKFSDAYKSFSVASKVNRANQMAQAAKINGVPAIAVDGRYLVVGQNVKSHADLLALTDKVIAKVRAERNPKKK